MAGSTIISYDEIHEMNEKMRVLEESMQNNTSTSAAEPPSPLPTSKVTVRLCEDDAFRPHPNNKRSRTTMMRTFTGWKFLE